MTHSCTPPSPIWISGLSLLLTALLGLTGCASKISGRMPSGGLSMTESYQQAMIGDQNTMTIINARRLHVPLNGINTSRLNLQEESQSILGLHRLPNPDITMYIYPHWVGSGQVEIPVPGYKTVFPLYQKTHYSLL